MVRGAEGKAFRDAIIYKYGELNPVVMKAKGFWSRYLLLMMNLSENNDLINYIKAVSILIKNQIIFLNLKV